MRAISNPKPEAGPDFRGLVPLARAWRIGWISRVPAAVVGLALLSGCLLPKVPPDPTRFYVLAGSTARKEPAPDAPVVHLREVNVAGYLRGRAMIVRRGDHEIEFRDFARWGEPIEQGIVRLLRQELLARGAAGSVVAPGLRAARMEYDHVLAVRVLACEGAADGSVLFRAVWELTAADVDPVSRMVGDYRPRHLHWDVGHEESLAGGLSEAVNGLAAEIAAALVSSRR